MYLCTQYNQKQAVTMYRNIIKQLKEWKENVFEILC